MVCNDLRVENARQVVEECGQQASGLAVRADVSKSRQVTQMFARLAKRFSQLDILVNNAGIGLDNPTVRARFNTVLAKQQAELAKTGKIKTALEATQNLSDEEWRRMLSVHLDGTFYCSREALKIMHKQRSGQDHQHCLDLRHDRLCGRAALQRGQGRHSGLHPGAGPRGGCQRDTG